MTKIVVERLGEVEEAEVTAMLTTLRRLYDAVEEPPLLVYLVIASDRARFSSLLAYLHDLWGVKSSPSFEGLEATHDAYAGAPRLIACLEPLKALPSEVVEGIVLHEAAHTILHGSLEAYSAPRRVLEEAARLMGPEHAFNLAYLTATAVKDYEASKLLISLGFHREAKAHVLYLLSRREGLKEEWELSLKLNIPLLHLAEVLKPLCCAAPLLGDVEVEEGVEGYTSHLPAWARRGLREVIERGGWLLKGPLWSKVESLLQSLLSMRARRP
ncbi:MAG: hypothetical protein N3H31_05715 [Candidatus Nezhaarchaeota archaeon]|nr:hypothetical protein [Candidatus Nezhaarchaeota archaeon]